MKDCTVSIIGSDGKTHQVEVTAASAFDAVRQAVQQWGRLWWYDNQAVAEVRAGDQRWRVRPESVRRKGQGAPHG